MKRKFLSTVIIALVGFIGLMWFMAWVMLPGPHKFFVGQNPTEEDRIALRDRLAKELDNFEEDLKKPSYISSAVNDVDRGRPVDMTLIASAIQNYVIEQDKLPDSMEELQTGGYVLSSSLEGHYDLTVENGKWEVRGSTGNLFAEGN